MDLNTQALRDYNENINMEGFDLDAGKSWIYPTNYSVRNYQYNIVSESLYKNTLVSLPTGLGKTFIAAVVMFNFYRWYPSGKVIFMAPTKPLVKQQIDACYNIMAIPKETTAELTGTKVQTSRVDLWTNKRVFFITPQVLQNDLNLVPELGNQIKCIVIDEAHRAKGNYAYCEVIRQITQTNKHFRILALSATPGSTINDISEVIKNLLISHLEIKTEDSPDVEPYVFHRTMEKIVVPLGGKLQSVKAAYLQILEKYTRILVENKIIPGNNCANLTKGRMFMLMKDFQEKNKHTKIKAYGDIMRNLNLCITLYHGYELLTRHGLRGFLNYFEEHSDKALLRGNVYLHNIMMDVQEYLGPKPCTDILPDGTVPDMPSVTKFGHPKFYKLQDILLNYFTNPNNTSSKVIIFTEYRDSVMEIYALLIRHAPIIKAKYFLGQSSITQKQQITAIKSFRSGECNTLISTCIGEEGLDIGEVDLIICFDISNKSPIRLVQRMGRTGRKKEGKIVVLVTEGKEEEILKDCLVNKHYLSKNILTSRELHSNLYQHNPRMVPETVSPICQKIHISVPINTKTKGGSLKNMLNNMKAASTKALSQEFSNIEIIEMQNRIPEVTMIWNKGKCMMDIDDGTNKIAFSKHLEILRVQQQTNKIGHSRNCDILTSLLQYADSKRYNIPITQKDSKKSKFGRHKSSDNYKQSDIRTMFMKSQSSSTQSTPEDIKIIRTFIDEDMNELSKELHNEISTHVSLSCIEEVDCKICANLFTCYRTTKMDCDFKLDEWIQPNFSIVEGLVLGDILSFRASLKPVTDILSSTDLAIFEDFSNEDWDDLDDSFKDTKNKSHLFSFEAPKSATKVLQMSHVSGIHDKNNSNNESLCGKTEFKHEEKFGEQDLTSSLSFFKLDEISAIYNADDEAQKRMDWAIEGNKSPSLVRYSQKINENNVSPIINTFTQRKLKNDNSYRELFSQNKRDLSLNNKHTQEQALVGTSTNKLKHSKPNLSNLNSAKKSFFYKSKTDSETSPLEEYYEPGPVNKITNKDSSGRFISQLVSNVSDFCDLSIFGLEPEVTNGDIKNIKNECSKEVTEDAVNTADVSNCDSDDLFGSCTNSPQPEMKSNFDLNDIYDLNVFGISNVGRSVSVKDETPAGNSDKNEKKLSPLPISNSKRSSPKYNTEDERKENVEDNSDWNEHNLSPILTGSDKRNFYKHIKGKEVNEINKCNESFIDTKKHAKPVPQEILNLTINDICDMSIFEKEYADFESKSVNVSNTNLSNESKQEICSFKRCDKTTDLTTHDICDMSIFGIQDIDFESKSTNLSSAKSCSQNKLESYLRQSNKVIKLEKASCSSQNGKTLIENELQISTTQILNLINKDNTNNSVDCARQSKNMSTPKNKGKTPIRKLSLDKDSNTSNCISPKLLKQEQTSAKKKYNFAKRKRPLSPCDSEDEFEDPSKSTGWIQVKKKVNSNLGTPEKPPHTSKFKKRKKKRNLFINSQAVLDSSDIAFQDSHSEGGSSDDAFQSSFVNDQTINFANTTDIHAKYLQTTKSPIRNKGVFKIPELCPLRNDVFSQVEPYGNDTYLNDSFCVDDDEDNVTLSQNTKDLSELEIAELILEEERKEKSKKQFFKRKAKAIIISSDSE